MASTGLEVRETGCTLRVQTEAPHLVSKNNDRLPTPTAITLHPLPQGRIVIGSSREADVIINDKIVEPVDCSIENNDGNVTLDPINGLTCVDNALLNPSERLTQGCTMTIGRSNDFRSNGPAEADHSMSIVDNSQMSMTPISFRRMEEANHLEHKPPVVPRKSPRNSYSSDDESGFLGKLNKFEMLARQSSRNYVSPKVFPVGSLTANVPADQILGHSSRSPSAGSLWKSGQTGPLQNLTNLECSRSSTPSGEQRLAVGCQNAPSLNHVPPAKSQMKAFKAQQYNDENDVCDVMSRSLTLPRRITDLDCFNHEFDMSRSLVVAKTTTTEFFQLNQFGSNPNLYENSSPSANGFSNTCCRRIKTPSSAFNRNPRFVEPKKVCMKSLMPGSSACSLEELREKQIDAVNKRKMAENRRVQAQEDRIKEQECERQEKIRLEEILAMCAEYERQSTVEKPKQPNRIITNGSLPRDKRPGYNSPFGSPKSQPNHSQFIFESHRQNSNLNALNLNGNINQNNNYNNRIMNENQHDLSPNNNVAFKWNPGFCNSLPRSRNSKYENVCADNLDGDICFEKPRQNSSDRKRSILMNGNVSVYENVSLFNDGDMDELADSKITVSNDDLLEAIEQLSMLSKGRVDTKKQEAKEDLEKKMDNEDRKKHFEFLQHEKTHIMSNMEVFKRNVTDIEAQEEDINRELELEKALLSAEMESESLKLVQDKMEKTKVQAQITELDQEMSENNHVQLNLQMEAKQRVQQAQRACIKLEEKLANCNDQCLQEELSEKLNTQQDVLETERKAFEDLEFHHLEEEASKLATREELQRYLSELSIKIERRTNTLTQLELQKEEIQSTATKEAKNLEQLKLGHMRRLEESRNRLRAIEDELHNLSRELYQNGNEKHLPSREDLDRISKVTNESPIVGKEGSLGPKTMESLKEIERNRQLHLAIQGKQVISEERRKVEELKRRVQTEVRTKWEERKMNCASFNSVESGEESSNYSTGLTESGSGNSDGAEGANSDKLSPSKLSEFTSPSPGPSNNSDTLLQSDSIRDDRRISSMDRERFVGGINENGSRPLSQTSSEIDTFGSMQPIKHREKAKMQRPLTRYLPIKSESLNLREFVEAAGHQLSLINDVEVDKTSCRGYLSKMSKKFHHWNKRWFIFDRAQKTISYYADSSNRKTRGIIYFQAIEHVYIDYMNSVKSPQPQLTFIVKTSSRLYHLMASSAEAMRVWVDVVFTGAEGYREFDRSA